MMGALELIIVLTVVGFLMMAAEVFVPGMILGLLGGISLITAVATAFYNYGLITGTFVLVAVGLATLVGFVVWMNAFPHTAIGRRLMLQKNHASGEGDKEQPVAPLLGLTGQAITTLRPSGTAVINGQRIDVVAESELIDAGTDVLVVHQEGMRVVVRKSTGAIA